MTSAPDPRRVQTLTIIGAGGPRRPLLRHLPSAAPANF
ncbi:hypothetical protein MY5147_008897, partial [Beauveria neobassiana]